jgi:hypothetical protein
MAWRILKNMELKEHSKKEDHDSDHDKASKTNLIALMNLPTEIKGSLDNPEYLALFKASVHFIFGHYFIHAVHSKHPPAYYNCCKVWGEQRVLKKKGHSNESLIDNFNLRGMGVTSLEELENLILHFSKDKTTGLVNLPKVNIECSSGNPLSKVCLFFETTQVSKVDKCTDTEVHLGKRHQSTQTLRSAFPQSQADKTIHRKQVVGQLEGRCKEKKVPDFEKLHNNDWKN